MTNHIVIKSYGYGIVSVEILDQDIAKMGEMITSIFPSAQEWVQNRDNSNQIVIMIGEGHMPSEHELRQLDEELEWMKNTINKQGSDSFSKRLTMLESSKVKSITH